MGNGKLAQQASRLSGQYVGEGNREGWLSLFALDAIVQDPVGVSPLDPTGAGFKGRDAIAGFWDMMIAPGTVRFDIHHSHPAGDECANVITVQNILPDGLEIIIDMVVVYTANAEGKISSLKAYWEFDRIQQQLDAVKAN